MLGSGWFFKTEGFATEISMYQPFIKTVFGVIEKDPWMAHGMV